MIALVCLLFVLGVSESMGTHHVASQGDDGFYFETLAHVGGASKAIALSGDRVLLGEGESVLVIDARAPSAPRVLGRSPALGGEVQDVAASGSLAYVAADNGGLVALDIADPAVPRPIGRYDPGWVGTVVIEGNRAYIVANARLQVLDITDPAAMRHLGTFTGDYAEDELAIVGGIVWAASANGLNGIDARDPAAMRLLSYTNGQAYGLAATADRVYKVNGFSGVEVLDVRDPTHPRQIDLLREDLGIVNGATLEGGRLHVAGMDYDAASGEHGGFIATFDVGDFPIQVSRANTGAPAEALAVRSGVSYVAMAPYSFDRSRASDMTTGLGIYRGAQRLGTLATLGNVMGVALADRRALVAAGTTGLAIFDVADPWLPVQLGAANTPGFAHRVTVDGDVALVADGGSDVRVFDVADPGQPRGLAHFAAEGTVADLAVERGIAIVAAGNALQVVDVRTPARPSAIGRASGGARAVKLHRGMVLAAGIDAALRLLDIAAPERPVPLGQWSPAVPGGDSLGVAAADGRAYLGQIVPGYLLVTRPPPGPAVTPGGPTVTPTFVFAAPAAPQSTAPPDGGGFQIVDIRTPEAPVTLGRLTLDGPVSALAADAERRRVFVGGMAASGWSSILRAIDVSDPAQPADLGTRIDRFDYGGLSTADLVFANGLLYVAALDDGLWILRPVAPGDPSPTPTPLERPSATPVRPSVTPTPTPRPPDRARIFVPLVGKTWAGGVLNG